MARTFYVNSRNRLSGTDEDFTAEVAIPATENYDRVCVIDISIPKSYYLVQSGRNTFTLTESNGSAVITMDPGNYSMTTFKNALVTKLNTASASLNGWTYSISIPTAPQTGKYTFSATGGTGAQPSFTVTTYLYEQLGFVTNTTNTFAGGTLTSTNVVKFQLEDNLFVHSDLVGDGKDDVLAHVNAGATPDYSVVSWQCPEIEMHSKKLTAMKSNIYRFSLTNEDGEVMSLNGLNMTLTIHVHKREESLTLQLLKAMGKVIAAQ